MVVNMAKALCTLSLLGLMGSSALRAEEGDVCSVMDAYVAAAETEFAALQGDMLDGDSGDQEFEATRYLPEASRCWIEAGIYQGNQRLRCRYLFLDEEDRRVGLQAMREALTQCAGLSGLQLYSVRTLGYKGTKDVEIQVRQVGQFDAEVSVEHFTDAQIDAGQ